jgi:hypothetical protein
MKKSAVVLDSGYDSYDQEAKSLAGAGYELEVCPLERHEVQGKIDFA